MNRAAFASGLTLLAALPVALASSPASAQGVGDIYWGLAGGAQFTSDNEIGNDDVSFDPGFMIGGQLCYIFGSVTAEGEIEYSDVDVKDIDNTNNDDASLSALRGTGSLYFDFIGFSQSNILPYVGGGFGFSSLDFDGDISDDEVGLTAHGEVGVSFASASNFDFVVAYRYEWTDTDVGDLDKDLIAHQVRIGLRFFP
jgi:opacity protein-like surface antigen